MAWKSKTETIISDLLGSWGFYESNHDSGYPRYSNKKKNYIWSVNYNYIFNTLLPNVIKRNYDHIELTEKEKEAFDRLQEHLTSSEWNNLSDLIHNCIHQKTVRSENDKKFEVEEEARLKVEEDRKKSLIEDLFRCFEDNFLNSDVVYKKQFSMVFSKEEFEAKKISYVRKWIKTHTGNDIDSEQARAVGSLDKNIQVVARAGSGKTATIINRAIFLHKHLGIPEDQIILVAFNKKAQEEMEQRLAKYFDKPPLAVTFHALAYRIVNPLEDIIFDGDGSSKQSHIFQGIIDDYLRNDIHESELRKIMLRHFKNELDVIAGGKYDQNEAEFLEYRRSLSYQTLNNDYVKSEGEKQIANFLFEHGINYDYEKAIYWKGTPYRPDFSLRLKNDSEVIIEYFGLTNNAKYNKERKEKIDFWKDKEEYIFIEIYPGETDENNLKLKLEKLGIKWIRLSEDEIWKLVRERAIDRFSKVTKNFIGRCRQLSINPLELEIDSHMNSSGIDKDFIRVMRIIYEAYLDSLLMNVQEDFSGLLIKAIDNIKKDQTLIKHKGEVIGDLKKIKYMFIDEYQDLTKTFFELINAIKSKNKFIELFCVGDDWQAINMFAGSDLEYYKNFDKYFNNCNRITISSNYRSADSIVRFSNELMKNEEGIPAVCNRDISGNVLLANYNDNIPNSLEESGLKINKITSTALRFIKNTLDNDKEIVFLLRNNRIPYIPTQDENSSPKTFLKKIRSYFPESEHKNINISTIHQYKGKECDVVVIFDLRHNSYPAIHPDWIFNIFFGDNIEKLIDEERRLFYVALTRPINTLILLADNVDDPSPFLKEVIDSPFLETIQKLDWKNFPQIELDDKANFRVIFSAAFEIKSELKSAGYSYNSSEKSWGKSVSANNYPLETVKEELENSININNAKENSIKVEIIRGNKVEVNEIQSGKWGIWKKEEDKDYIYKERLL